MTSCCYFTYPHVHVVAGAILGGSNHRAGIDANVRRLSRRSLRVPRTRGDIVHIDVVHLGLQCMSQLSRHGGREGELTKVSFVPPASARRMPSFP